MKSIDAPKPSRPAADRLRELLRRGDPAADGRAPAPEEVRLLRARVLEEARRSPGRARRGALRPAVAFGWAALVCVVVLVATGTAFLWRSEPTPDPPLAAGAVDEAAPRQVQFTTPGGTRIVWVLYPESP